MRNRAKCKLCKDIVESFHVHDYVTCSCGEIAVDGGLQYLKAVAKNWENFLRVDDEGNEIIVKIDCSSESSIEKEAQNTQNTQHKPSKVELLEMLHDMIKAIENLPPAGMSTYITHYDYVSLLILLSALFRADD